MNWLPVAHFGVAVLGGLVAMMIGSPLVTWVFRRADPPGGGEEQTMLNLLGAEQQLRGGSWIGRLERLAVYVTLVTQYPAGIAVIVAVKALARYPELKSTSAGAAERFIIGTFVSVLSATAAAGLVLWINSTF